jgi:hypothetical protein
MTSGRRIHSCGPAVVERKRGAMTRGISWLVLGHRPREGADQMALQRPLNTESWPVGATVELRIGVRIGELMTSHRARREAAHQPRRRHGRKLGVA